MAEAGFAGVTPILTYDPLGRPIQVDLPNKTVRRVAFDPWQQITWDENDLVAEAVTNGANSALTGAVPTSHADTPAIELLSAVFAQGRSSRLEQRLVEREQLALTVQAGTNESMAWAATSPNTQTASTMPTVCVKGVPSAAA